MAVLLYSAIRASSPSIPWEGKDTDQSEYISCVPSIYFFDFPIMRLPDLPYCGILEETGTAGRVCSFSKTMHAKESRDIWISNFMTG